MEQHPTKRRRSRYTGSVEQRGKTVRIRYSIDGQRYTETVKSGKRSDAERLLHQRLMEAEQGFVVLRDQRKQTPLFCPYVFHRQGKPIKMFRRVWERALREAGCPEKLFHDFRRTAVRNMIRASIPESIAMEIAGFRTRSVFKRYHIMKETDLQEAAQKLARYQHEQHQAYAQVIPFPAR